MTEKSLAQAVAELPDAEREQVLAGLELDDLQYDPQFWLRPTQLRPINETDWQLAAMVAGRGAGKTRSMCEWSRKKAQGRPTRGALVARTAADVRDVLVAGESGILAVSPPSERPDYEPSKRLLTWPNGTTALCFSSEAPDQLRGPQFDWSVCDEIACIPAGVLIITEHGEVPIEEVQIGELVRTRSGWNRVLWSGPTRVNAELWEIETAEGHCVRATPDHLVWTQRGWVRVDALVRGDTLTTWPSSSSGMAAAGTETARTATTETGQDGSSTVRSGHPSTGRSQAGTTSTMQTTTAATTRSTTSSACPTPSTPATTSPARGLPSSPASGHENARSASGRTRSSALSLAPGVEKRSPRPDHGPSSAMTPRIVEPLTVATVSAVRPLPEREQTYDLTVEHEHEFFANGILVHNSWKYLPDESGLTAWDNVRLATRLGEHPQIFAGTTPKRTPFMRSLLKAAETETGVLLLRGSTKDNRGNLSQTYIDMIYGLYEGTALAQQELEGIMLDDIDGALWDERLIEEFRVLGIPKMRRPLVAVGVDPSVSEKPGDETGIVVAVVDSAIRDMYKRHAYILSDASLQAAPEMWAKVLVGEVRRFRGAPVIAETNQGGGLIKAVLTGIDPDIRVFGVHSRYGKAIRAEPVVLAAQQGRVHHVGYFPELEDQLCTWVPDESRKSPDRLDAYVHVLTALLVKQPDGMHSGSVRARSAAGLVLPPAPKPRFRSGALSTVSRRSGGGRVL